MFCRHGKWLVMCLICNPPDHLVPPNIESDEALYGFTREEIEDLSRWAALSKGKGPER